MKIQTHKASWWSFCLVAGTLLLTNTLYAQAVRGPAQPEAGPGGADYIHGDVRFSGYASKADGYWLFEPADPRPDSAAVMVFLHGYGGYNPMVYGYWIRHLVRKGNIVIYPRYQRDLFFPGPKKFAPNAAKGIRDALQKLRTGDHVRPTDAPLIMAGHSYGGVIALNLAVHADSFGIPAPAGVLLAAPGTGPLNGGRLDDYSVLPPDLRLLIVVPDRDGTVGDEFAHLAFRTAVNTPRRNLLRHYADDHGAPGITAGHNESYSLDTSFDTFIRNFTARRSLRMAHNSAVDYYGYWKLLDALTDCVREDKHCAVAFGGTPEQRSLGRWSDGTPVKPMKVWLAGEEVIE